MNPMVFSVKESPLDISKIMPESNPETTVDGSEIPNNHLWDV